MRKRWMLPIVVTVALYCTWVWSGYGIWIGRGENGDDLIQACKYVIATGESRETYHRRAQHRPCSWLASPSDM